MTRDSPLAMVYNWSSLFPLSATDLGTVPVAREEIPNRRHTIVGCHQDDDEDDVDLVGDDDDADDMEAAARALDSVDGPSSYSMGPPPAPQPPAKVVDQQKEEETDDRLSLTLEEIVHIRSVMTKAELEGLPIEVRIKEDVEKRKVKTMVYGIGLGRAAKCCCLVSLCLLSVRSASCA